MWLYWCDINSNNINLFFNEALLFSIFLYNLFTDGTYYMWPKCLCFKMQVSVFSSISTDVTCLYGQGWYLETSYDILTNKCKGPTFLLIDKMSIYMCTYIIGRMDEKFLCFQNIAWYKHHVYDCYFWLHGTSFTKEGFVGKVQTIYLCHSIWYVSGQYYPVSIT